MIVGMVAAKHDSRRFPGKNRYLYRGVPLFWHSVAALQGAESVDRVLVGTDSPDIKRYCEERGVEVVWRPRVAAQPEASLLTVLRFMYQHLDEEPEMVVSIMANCPGHTPQVVDAAVAKMRRDNLREVRSFNREGDESGLLVLRPEVVARISEISAYMGIVTSDVDEVHTQEDLCA